jgi:Raf kinase inhibitor-like YbhB/YbcL family protein
MENCSRNFFILVFMTFWSFSQIPASGGEKMEVSSTAFKDGGKIPLRYVMVPAGGKNLSIPLSWKNFPPETKSFAVSIIDPHPVAQNWVHWFVINIPVSAPSLPEGASGKGMPAGSVELKNSFGDIGYGGPQPPKGSGEHPYVVTLYALKADKLDLGAATSLAAFKKALEGKVIQSASITGTYER